MKKVSIISQRSNSYQIRFEFPDDPPEYIRVRAEKYRFTTAEERRASGNWWAVEPLGIYLPPAGLQPVRN